MGQGLVFIKIEEVSHNCQEELMKLREDYRGTYSNNRK